MDTHRFTLGDLVCEALPSGALWSPERRLLCVSDLHLGKAARIARREGRLTPPYEAEETLARLGELAAALRPALVICLGDSFDDDEASSELSGEARATLTAMMAGRRWVWIAGNHDPAPVGLGGEHRAEITIGGVVFRHIADPEVSRELAEASGHYHPKVRLRGPSRPAFLLDRRRVILPAFGLYTGGLDIADAAFDQLASPDALALITGRRIVAAPRSGLMRRG